MILLCTRLFWRFSHVVTSLYSWLIYRIRRPNLAIASRGQRRWLQKRRFIKIEFELLQTFLHLFQPNSFIFWYAGQFFWGLIWIDCMEVQEKKNKVVVLCWRFGKKRELRPHFHFAVSQWRKEMYKKAWSRAKFFFCQSKAISIAFFPFSLPLLSSSSLLKLRIVYNNVYFIKDINKTNTFLFTPFTKPRKLGT